MPPRPSLSVAERAAIDAFVAAARAELGSDFRSARLFGSRARGEGDEHSDIDIALIVGSGGRARRHALDDGRTTSASPTASSWRRS